jgi:hypothetical protein
MAIRWWRSGHLKPDETRPQLGSVLHHDAGWRWKMTLNGFGALCTFVVMIIFAVTKFALGAWIVIVIIPALVFFFFRIHIHYKNVAAQLSLESFGSPPRVRRNRVLIPIGGVHRGVVTTLRFARSLSDDVTAVYVSQDPAETPKVIEKWQQWGDGIRLKVLESPYRQMTEPLLEYIDELEKERQPHEMLTIVVPRFIPQHAWERILHFNTASFLRLQLFQRPDVVVMEAPYHLANKPKS